MSNSGYLMLMLAAVLGADPQWERTPAGLLVTGATLWKIGAADRVHADRVVELMSGAHIARHRTDNTHMLVFDSRRVDTDDAFLNFSTERENELYLDETRFVERLRALRVNLPEGALSFSAPLPHARDLARTDTIRQWYLLSRPPTPPAAPAPPPPAASSGITSGTSPGTVTAPPATPAPAPIPLPPMRSVLMEWGNPEAVQRLERGLYNTETDPPTLVETRVYDKHFYKIPLKAEVYSAPLSDTAAEPTRVAEIPGLYALRPRYGTQSSGYLAFLTAAEGRRRLLLIELPKYETKTGGFDVEIPARCFLDYVISPALRKPSLSCRRRRTGGAETTCVETRPGHFRFRVTLPSAMPTDARTTQATNAASLASPNPRDSFELRLQRSEEVRLPVTDETEKVIVAAETCQGVPLPAGGR